MGETSTNYSVLLIPAIVLAGLVVIAVYNWRSPHKETGKKHSKASLVSVLFSLAIIGMMIATVGIPLAGLNSLYKTGNEFSDVEQIGPFVRNMMMLFTYILTPIFWISGLILSIRDLIRKKHRKLLPILVIVLDVLLIGPILLLGLVYLNAMF